MREVQHPLRGTKNAGPIARGINIDEQTMAKAKRKRNASDNEQNGGANAKTKNETLGFLVRLLSLLGLLLFFVLVLVLLVFLVLLLVFLVRGDLLVTRVRR